MFAVLRFIRTCSPGKSSRPCYKAFHILLALPGNFFSFGHVTKHFLSSAILQNLLGDVFIKVAKDCLLFTIKQCLLNKSKP